MDWCRVVPADGWPLSPRSLRPWRGWRDVALPCQLSDVCSRERRQSLDLRWADVGAEGGDDCLDHCLPCRLVVGLCASVVAGRGG
jgi:hypothetical protein